MTIIEQEIGLGAFLKILDRPGWHDGLSSVPPAGTYTVIINQKGNWNTVFVRHRYRFDGECWRTPSGSKSDSIIFAYHAAN